MIAKKKDIHKKTVGKLTKFFKNKKSVSVALGVCLAVFASAYVATAKFSADTKINQSSYVPVGYLYLKIRVIDKKSGKGVGGIQIGSFQPQTINNKDTRPSSDSATGKGETGGDGYITSGGSGEIYKVFNKDGKLTKYFVGEITNASDYDDASKETVYLSDEYLKRIGKEVKTSNALPKTQKDFEALEESGFKGNGLTGYYSRTIVVYSDGSGGKVLPLKSINKTSSKSTATGVSSFSKPVFTIKLRDKANNIIKDTEIKIKFNYTNGKQGNLSSAGKTDSNGVVKVSSLSICDIGKSKKLCYDKDNIIKKAEIYVTKDGKDTNTKRYIIGDTVKDSSLNITLTGNEFNSSKTTTVAKVKSTAKSATSKMSTATKSVVSKIIGKTSSGAKVNTTPTAKDKVTFKEALPPVKLSTSRKLNFQIKKGSNLTPGTVKITVAYKECTAGGCGGATGSDFKQTTFKIDSKNGMGSIDLGITNVPQVKTSLVLKKKTTVNRYFFFYGSPTKIVRHIYISDINDLQTKEIPIGGYPFAINTEAAAQKFQLKLFTYTITGDLPAATATPTTAPTTTPTSSIPASDTDAIGAAISNGP